MINSFAIRATQRPTISIGALVNQHLDRIFCSPWTLLVCKLTIGLVSAYDIFLTIKYVDFLPNMELNPIGRWLMQLDNGPACHLGQIAGFVASKFAGNFLSLCVIELLAAWRGYVAAAVAFAVAALQVLLLLFLIFG